MSNVIGIIVSVLVMYHGVWLFRQSLKEWDKYNYNPNKVFGLAIFGVLAFCFGLFFAFIFFAMLAGVPK